MVVRAEYVGSVHVVPCEFASENACKIGMQKGLHVYYN